MSHNLQEFEKIYTSNVAHCMAVAMSLLGNEDEARDLVQDVFLKIWDSKMEIKNMEAFVVRSVRNACLDRLAALDVRQRLRQQMTVEIETTDQEDSVAEIEKQHKDVRKAIDTLLTPREQQVIDKVYSEGLSYKDTASKLNVSVALVNKCLVSAMKTLRGHFKSRARTD